MQIRVYDVKSLCTPDICEARLAFSLEKEEEPILTVTKSLYNNRALFNDTLVKAEKEINNYKMLKSR